MCDLCRDGWFNWFNKKTFGITNHLQVLDASNGSDTLRWTWRVRMPLRYFGTGDSKCRLNCMIVFFINHLSIWSVFFTWDIWVYTFIYAPIYTHATLKYMFTYIHDNHTSFCGRTSIQTRPKVYHPQVTPCGCSNCRKSLAGSPGITSVLPCENRAGFFWCRRLSSRVVWGKVALGCFDKGWKKVVIHEGFPVNIWICLDFVCGCFFWFGCAFHTGICPYESVVFIVTAWEVKRLDFLWQWIFFWRDKDCVIYIYMYEWTWFPLLKTRVFILFCKLKDDFSGNHGAIGGTCFLFPAFSVE